MLRPFYPPQQSPHRFHLPCSWLMEPPWFSTLPLKSRKARRCSLLIHLLRLETTRCWRGILSLSKIRPVMSTHWNKQPASMPRVRSSPLILLPTLTEHPTWLTPLTQMPTLTLPATCTRKRDLLRPLHPPQVLSCKRPPQRMLHQSNH